MGKYTFNDLMKRYDSKQSALSQFIARHRTKLGSHAVKTSDGWFFDDYAVQVLDRLKNYNQPVLAPESAEIDSLHTTIANLQTALLSAQNETMIAQKKAIALMERNIELENQLTAARQQLIAVAQIKSDKDKLQKLLSDHIAGIDDNITLVLQNVKRNHSVGWGWNRRGVGGRKVSLVNVRIVKKEN